MQPGQVSLPHQRCYPFCGVIGKSFQPRLQTGAQLVQLRNENVVLLQSLVPGAGPVGQVQGGQLPEGGFPLRRGRRLAHVWHPVEPRRTHAKVLVHTFLGRVEADTLSCGPRWQFVFLFLFGLVGLGIGAAEVRRSGSLLGSRYHDPRPGEGDRTPAACLMRHGEVSKLLRVSSLQIFHHGRDLLDLQLHPHEVYPQVLELGLLEDANELVVAHSAHVPRLHQLENILEVSPVDIHEIEVLAHGRVRLVSLDDLLESQIAVSILVRFLEYGPKLLSERPLYFFLPLDHLIVVRIPGRDSLVHNDGEDEIGKAQLDGNQSACEHQERHGRMLHDRYGANAPGVACHQGLEEVDH
mmetsp:Transcript_1773/g.4511  ORF Transcript_1773/g.4511 Transcript_1773/m.4511 type:complete len:353 (+) Transcript_1773:322-1380(+)